MARRFVSWTALALSSFSLLPGALADEILNIGDAAPPLVVSKWIKGDHVETFDPGKMYVVEFWATWCGPCRASIPHLTELAHEYKDQGIRFVGIDTWEDDTTSVTSFVEEMGDKMDYSVAVDSIPEGKGAREGSEATNWMKAADEHGIPTAFIINDGRIAWVGHPMELKEPLEKIHSGDWNLADAAKERLVEKEKERQLREVRSAILTPYRAKDYKAAVVAIDEAAIKYPELAGEYDSIKFAALANGGDVEPGLKLGAELLDKYKDDGQSLNEAFWFVIDPDLGTTVDPRISQLALTGLNRAVDLTKEEDPGTLDSLAVAQFRVGEVDAAVATEEKAIKLLQANASQADENLKIYNDRIASFRKGVLKGSDEK